MPRLREIQPVPRLLALLGMTLVAVLVLMFHGPITQSAAYHAFAD